MIKGLSVSRRAVWIVKKQQIIASQLLNKFKDDVKNKESAQVYFQQFVDFTLILELFSKEFDVSSEELAFIDHLVLREIEKDNLNGWLELINSFAIEMGEQELKTSIWQYVKSIDLSNEPDTAELPEDMDILEYGYIVTSGAIRLFFADGEKTSLIKKEQEADNDAERSMNKEKQNAGS
jgi:hypothetical protein